MENNEIMEVIEMDDVVVADENTGMGTGVAMLIGAGIAFAVGAGVKLVKKGIAAYKAKKEAQKHEHDFCVDEADIEDSAK